LQDGGVTLAKFSGSV